MHPQLSGDLRSTNTRYAFLWISSGEEMAFRFHDLALRLYAFASRPAYHPTTCFGNFAITGFLLSTAIRHTLEVTYNWSDVTDSWRTINLCGNWNHINIPTWVF
jgi:hypothetical protein